jgi:hypothetical protein
LSNTFRWLASRSIAGGFATAGALGLMAMNIPPGSVHNAIDQVARSPSTLLTRACESLAGVTTPASTAGIFNGFGVLFYSMLWYVLLSVIVQIKGE